MMALAANARSPLAALTRTSPGLGMVAVPDTTSTRWAFSSLSTPPTRRATTSSLRALMRAQSGLTRPSTSTPYALASLAAR